MTPNLNVAPEPESPLAWSARRDLCGSLTIDNITQADVGPVLEVLREAGFVVEINVTRAEHGAEPR